MITKTHSSAPYSLAISNWLFAMAALVFAMIIIGAITRLTESGLSIVEWEPFIGAIPPLNDAHWHDVFEQYKQTPEFQKKNFWMGIEDFKKIYFWEWLHRQMGRLIGLAFAIPYLYFILSKKIPKGYKLKLFVLFILGGMQAALGWYMVKSGLVDRPSVSHYRLAAHLGMALLIFVLILWHAFTLRGITKLPQAKLFYHGCVTAAFVIITVLWGAFTAGLDAGLVYNEFPNMGAGLVPPDMWHLTPAWTNIFENIPSIQFMHRWLAITAFIVVASLWAHALKAGYNGFAFHALMMITLCQVGLGIATLLSGVHIHVATMHQGGAVLLLLTLTYCLYKTKPPKEVKSSL